MMAQPSAEAPKADVANRPDAPSDDDFLEASASSGQSTTDPGTATSGRAPIAATEETPATILTGTVLGPDGDPYSGCHVVVMLQPMSEAFERRTGPPIPPWTTTTDEAGEFQIDLDLSEAEEWRGSLYAASSQITMVSHPLALEGGRRYDLRPMRLPHAKTKEEIPPFVHALMVWSATLSGK